jgi:hypothetical protein
MSIKSKIHKYGHEHEASWPPSFVEKPRGVVGYIDPETKQFKEGYPPNPNNQFGVAPMAIFDSMPKTYHEKAGCFVESRSEWERLDQATGSMTFGSIAEPKRHMAKALQEERKALKQDRRRAAEEAIKMVRANPTEIRQKLNQEAEKQRAAADKAGITKLLADKGIQI